MSFSSDVRSELMNKPPSTGPKAYVRKCFIEGGTIANPVKSYHLAFNLPEQKARRLVKILANHGHRPKTLVKSEQVVVYLKEADEIADVLRLMGAQKSVLVFESERVEKDFRNGINRQVNCEAANLNKTVTAAQHQIDAIKHIENTVGLGYLSKPLQEIARLRQEHDTANLAEIGEMLNPPIGKSGVNHRLRKICEIADNI